jgi:hypothetical protein
VVAHVESSLATISKTLSAMLMESCEALAPFQTTLGVFVADHSAAMTDGFHDRPYDQSCVEGLFPSILPFFALAWSRPWLYFSRRWLSSCVCSPLALYYHHVYRPYSSTSHTILHKMEHEPPPALQHRLWRLVTCRVSASEVQCSWNDACDHASSQVLALTCSTRVPGCTSEALLL